MAQKKVAPKAVPVPPDVKPRYMAMAHWTPRNLRKGRKR